MAAGRASIATNILERYAADAASEVAGVRSRSGKRSIRVGDSDGLLRVELHVAVDWGTAIPDVARELQTQVREYLQRMVGVEPTVDVVVDEIAHP
jgi:uncharacterized alkaline shock family protein YloU